MYIHIRALVPDSLFRFFVPLLVATEDLNGLKQFADSLGIGIWEAALELTPSVSFNSESSTELLDASPVEGTPPVEYTSPVGGIPPVEGTPPVESTSPVESTPHPGTSSINPDDSGTTSSGVSPIPTPNGGNSPTTPNQKFKDKAAQDFIVQILAALVELATCKTQTEVNEKQAVIKELVASAKGLGVIDVIKVGVVSGIANQSSPKQKEDMGYYFEKINL